MTTKTWIASATLVVGLTWPAGPLRTESSRDPLELGFKSPPDSARPRVWWHWMNGNITKEGITADLQWMKRVGIGGVQIFDVALLTPKVVPKPLAYMTTEWQEALRHAVALAHQLGLEVTIAASPGWSETGGPWVKPPQAMKKLVWSETRLEGGRPFKGVLPRPPAVAGPFQNIRNRRDWSTLLGLPERPDVEYYVDSAVVAFPVPPGELVARHARPRVTVSDGQCHPDKLSDGDFETAAVKLPKAPVRQAAWIQFEFPKPQTIYAFTLALKQPMRAPFDKPGETGQQLEASDDQRQFRLIAKVPGDGAPVHTLAFKPITARFFRLSFLSLPETPLLNLDIPGLKLPPPPTSFEITELVLHTSPRIHRFEEKAGFGLLPTLHDLVTPKVDPKEVVPKNAVVDLTAKMQPDGSLVWTPPPGQWIVLRMGYSLLGVINHPASPEATGLEVDKLNRDHVRSYLETYFQQLEDATGGRLGDRGIRYLLTDSWEAGVQNWTENILSEFVQRRGYPIHPWLPVLTGRVLDSAEASERFLWDFRKTIAELTAEQHYDEISAFLKRHGMGRYSESHESTRAFIGDGMEVKRSADVPMGAIWIPSPLTPSAPYEADIRESASVAHLYGQNIVAAESFTVAGFGENAYKWAPENLKPVADLALASGVNRFVIHTSVHQAIQQPPGISLGPFGQWFTRHETWAEQAEAWVSYLARSCFLLQQGKFVADILYLYGEDSNVTALFRETLPAIPKGYAYDFVNADALVNLVSVENGQLTTRTGMKYRVLALDPSTQYITLPVLRKIRDLVKAGATVVGSKPLASPSLRDDTREFQAIVDTLWRSASQPTAFGKGKVYPTLQLSRALAELQIPSDFEYKSTRVETQLLFVHRTLNGTEIYWVNNRQDRTEEVDAIFRVSGKEAELWYPETGEIEPASYRSVGGRTVVPLRLNPYGAVFVLFRKPAASQSRLLPQRVEVPLATLEGPWEVSFQPGRGAPDKLTFPELISWTESPNAGVKYFSGTATYTISLTAPTEWFEEGARVYLDLGEVKNLAEVVMNGLPVGTAWTRPFRVELTKALRRGRNLVEIKVTNLWPNRMIGDLQAGTSERYTFSTFPFFKADSALLPAGLLGPVRVLRATVK